MGRIDKMILVSVIVSLVIIAVMVLFGAYYNIQSDVYKNVFFIDVGFFIVSFYTWVIRMMR